MEAPWVFRTRHWRGLIPTQEKELSLSHGHKMPSLTFCLAPPFAQILWLPPTWPPASCKGHIRHMAPQDHTRHALGRCHDRRVRLKGLTDYKPDAPQQYSISYEYVLKCSKRPKVFKKAVASNKWEVSTRNVECIFFLKKNIKESFSCNEAFRSYDRGPWLQLAVWENIYHHINLLFGFDEPVWKLRGKEGVEEYLLMNNLFPSKVPQSKLKIRDPCIKKFWKDDLCLSPISGTQISASYRRTLKRWFSFSIPTPLFLCPLISAFALFLVLQLWLSKQKPVVLRALDLFLFLHHRPRSLDMSHSHCSGLSVSSKTLWNMESESLPKTHTPELKTPKCTGSFSVVMWSSCRRPQALNQQTFSTTMLWVTVNLPPAALWKIVLRLKSYA